MEESFQEKHFTFQDVSSELSVSNQLKPKSNKSFYINVVKISKARSVVNIDI